MFIIMSVGCFFFCRLTDDRGCVNIHSTTGMFNS